MAVVMMFVLIGVAVMSLTLLFATEIRRTRAAVNGTQLRQLLLAGAAAAIDQLRTGGNADHEGMLKIPLAGASAEFHIVASGAEAATVRVTAGVRDARAAETLQLSRDKNGAWVIGAAALQE